MLKEKLQNKKDAAKAVPVNPLRQKNQEVGRFDKDNRDKGKKTGKMAFEVLTLQQQIH